MYCSGPLFTDTNAKTLAELSRICYRSLVDCRAQDFIQRTRAPSLYLTDRPNFTYGGPSPLIRALASHDELRRKKLAASLTVSRRSTRVDFEIEVQRRLPPLGWFNFSRHWFDRFSIR